jgi:hypothetical protein
MLIVVNGSCTECEFFESSRDFCIRNCKAKFLEMMKTIIVKEIAK